MNISNFFSNAILAATFRAGSYTFPSNVYLALYTSDPTAADTGQEVSAGAYDRKSIMFSDPAIEAGKMTIKNTEAVQFEVATADWGTITHVGIRDAATGGNLLYFGVLASPRTILSGDRITFDEDSIVLTLS